jgi:hypothetical protein
MTKARGLAESLRTKSDDDIYHRSGIEVNEILHRDDSENHPHAWRTSFFPKNIVDKPTGPAIFVVIRRDP